jgi:hypothetical protein
MMIEMSVGMLAFLTPKYVYFLPFLGIQLRVANAVPASHRVAVSLPLAPCGDRNTAADGVLGFIRQMHAPMLHLGDPLIAIRRPLLFPIRFDTSAS